MRTAALSGFYRLLATYLDSGVPMLRSLESLSRQAPRAARRAAVDIAHDINDGASLGEAIAARPATFPELHREIILAGERSGHLPELLKRLADMLDAALAQRRRLFTGLLYPALVLHLGVFVLAIAKGIIHFGEAGTTVSFRPMTSLLFIIIGLGPVYGAVGLLLLNRGLARRCRPWRAVCQTLIRVLPLLGKLHKQTSLARWARALEALYAAGIGLPKGLADAGRASGDIALEEQSAAAAEAMDDGADPAQALLTVRRFPVDVTAMLATGLESGKLDEMLRHIAAKQEDDAANTAKIFGVLAPVLAMLLIGGILVYFIISFFLQGYVQPINDLLGE